MANLLGKTTRLFMKLNQKKETNSWDTSDNLWAKVAAPSRIKIISTSKEFRGPPSQSKKQ